MKKLVVGVFLLCSALLATVQGTTNAHVLQADGDIGAILHIIPDDNPISGRPVDYTLSFQDVTRQFSLPKCDCFVAYISNGETVATRPLDSGSAFESTNRFTFPEPGVYTLKINGEPKKGASFQTFRLSYTVRVASGDIQTQDMPVVLWAGIIGIISLILLAAYNLEKG